MQLIGAKVRHATLGDGIIQAIKADIVIVQFFSKKEPSRFLYPNSIGRYLKVLRSGKSNSSWKNDGFNDYGHRVYSVRPVNIGRRTWNGAWRYGIC